MKINIKSYLLCLCVGYNCKTPEAGEMAQWTSNVVYI